MVLRHNSHHHHFRINFMHWQQESSVPTATQQCLAVSRPKNCDETQCVDYCGHTVLLLSVSVCGHSLIVGRAMAMGNLSLYSYANCSQSPFVKPYVLGYLPRILCKEKKSQIMQAHGRISKTIECTVGTANTEWDQNELYYSLLGWECVQLIGINFIDNAFHQPWFERRFVVPFLQHHIVRLWKCRRYEYECLCKSRYINAMNQWR